MDWSMENNKDARLLDRRSLAPLGTAVIAEDANLAAQVAEHNARIARAAVRVRQLAGDRQRLANFNAWQETDGANLLGEWSRLQRESWDALLELRHVLHEREVLLGQIEKLLRGQYDACDQEHEGVVATAERRMAPERRALVKTNPSTAGFHFAELVANDESVEISKTRLTAARSARDDTSAARRNIALDLHAVTARQREVFASLLA